MIYKLNEAIERKEIGVYPQVIRALVLDNDLNYFEKTNKSSSKNKKKNIPTIQIELHDKAIRTDYLSAGSDNLKKTISNSFYQFLKPYSKPHKIGGIKIANDSHVFDRKSNAFILRKGAKVEYYDYSHLHILNPEENFISYKKSEFFIDYRDNYFNNIGTNGVNQSYMEDSKHQLVQLDSKRSFNNLYDELRKDKTHRKVILARKVVFCLEDVEPECLFRISSPIPNLSGYYVTEKLREKILEQNFTGMVFTKLKDLNRHMEIEFI